MKIIALQVIEIAIFNRYWRNHECQLASDRACNEIDEVYAGQQ